MSLRWRKRTSSPPPLWHQLFWSYQWLYLSKPQSSARCSYTIFNFHLRGTRKCSRMKWYTHTHIRATCQPNAITTFPGRTQKRKTFTLYFSNTIKKRLRVDVLVLYSLFYCPTKRARLGGWIYISFTENREQKRETERPAETESERRQGKLLWK